MVNLRQKHIRDMDPLGPSLAIDILEELDDSNAQSFAEEAAAAKNDAESFDESERPSDFCLEGHQGGLKSLLVYVLKVLWVNCVGDVSLLAMKADGHVAVGRPVQHALLRSKSCIRKAISLAGNL
jgi:hypothetical protein